MHSTEQTMNPVTDQQVRHDLDDTRLLIEHAKGISTDEWARVRVPGHEVAAWEGPEESVAVVLERTVFAKEVWLAAIEGTDFPAVDRQPTPAALLERHDAVAGRWLATVRDIDRRGGWDDLIIDALCEPPESFVLSSIVAHVLTYSGHRRLLVRSWLRGTGLDLDDGDPINWLRRELDEHRDTPTGGDR
ncbi:DinB family protein [Nocardioides sp. J9]|uniref:DinB family protein n=1 Tax=Nocardioides sp. J9 TaxID=935844 RepID=UPI0021BD7913|nr:DinB family protein [Nocardioides sp. J9]